MQARQVLLDRKLDAIEEDYYSRRPKHMRNAQAAAATQSYEEFLREEEEKRIAENLNDKKKRQLLKLGVSLNNAQMLSLTTVNGRPVARSPHSRSSDYEQPNLQFQPTEAQLRAMDEIIETRQRHPILQMRYDAAIKEREQASPNSPQQPRPAVRSITFFNAEEAAKERLMEQNERRQVFKLGGSVEQATSMRAENSLMSLPVTLGHLNEGSLAHQSSSKMNRMLDRSFAVADQSGMLGTRNQKLSKQRTNPFATLDSTMSLGLRGGASAPRNHKRSQMFSTSARGDQGSPQRNSPQRGSLHSGSQGSLQRASMPQAKLYRAAKLSNVEVDMQHQLKHQVRNELTRSLRFNSGSINLMGKSQFGSPSQAKYAGPALNEDYNDLHKSQHSSSIRQMMNQDSSVLGIEPTALFEQEDSSTQMVESQNAM